MHTEDIYGKLNSDNNHIIRFHEPLRQEGNTSVSLNFERN